MRGTTTATTYTASNLAADASYTFAVAALDAAGSSAASSPISVHTAAPIASPNNSTTWAASSIYTAGMTANVAIIIAHKDNVLQIKNAALRYRPPEAANELPKAKSSPSGARPTGARERRPDRTVYVFSFGRPKAVQIKTGISDGIVTEVTDGLKEGDQVVTAELTSPGAAASPPANPFSGGQRRFP